MTVKSRKVINNNDRRFKVKKRKLVEKRVNNFFKLSIKKKALLLCLSAAYLTCICAIFMICFNKITFLPEVIKHLKETKYVDLLFLLLEISSICLIFLLYQLKKFIHVLPTIIYMVIFYVIVIQLFFMYVILLNLMVNILIFIELIIIYMFFYLVTYIIFSTYDKFLNWIEETENNDKNSIMRLTLVITVITLMLNLLHII